MNKLPLIKIKKPKKNKSQLNILSKSKGKVIQKEKDKEKDKETDEDKEKTNIALENNYSIAIDYYTKNIQSEQNNTNFLIKRAICYLAKGYYTLSLKDALKTIELDNKFNKGYYIASLCYLEMYDVENAEKYLQSKNTRLKNLIEKNKKDIINKTKKYKSYPLFINLLKELYRHNSFFPKLEVHFYTDDYRGVKTRSDITKNEIIMAIPKDCLISLETVYDTAYGKKIQEFMYKELYSPKHCLLSSFLLYEQKNKKYKYYFDLLPQNYDNFPIFYKTEELDFLKGSPFLAQIVEKKEDMKKDYNKLCGYLPNFSQFSLNSFCKARVLISSRIFGISIGKKKTDVLVPFADLLNHRRPKQTQWYYDDNSESFIIQAIEDIKEGSEIFDSYGKKTNSRFLLNYGFCLEDNNTSEYLMTIYFNEKYPLFETKKKIFKESKLDYKIKRSFNLNNNIAESQIAELLSFLRFALYDGDINVLYDKIRTDKNENENELELNICYTPAISKELEIKVLKYLHLLCKRALEKYTTTFEQDQNMYSNREKNNISFNLRNILLLLMDEKTVLAYYIYFSEYCIGLLKMKKQKDILAKLSTDYKNKDCQFISYIKEVILKFVKNDN